MKARAALLVAVAATVLVAGCVHQGDPADRYPRRVPVGVEGARPLRFFNVWPLWWANADVPNPIALTFDDGPSDWTPQVLDVLQGRDVPATFFVIANQIPGREWMLRRALDQGDRIGSHSYSHPDLSLIPFEALRFQVEYSRDIINGYMGAYPIRCLRPPYGGSNDTVVKFLAANTLAEARWDVDPTDWAVPPTQVIADRVVGAAHPGAVVLMHDGGGYRGNTVAALPQIIDRLRAQGYNFVSIC